MTLQAKHISCGELKYSSKKLPMNEDERGDAIRGIPKLSCLVVLEFYLGVPWESPRLGSFHSLFHSPLNPYPKLENFTTQNSTENS